MERLSSEKRGIEMSWLSALPFVGKMLGGPFEKVIDSLDADNRREFERAMTRIEGEFASRVAQIEVNKAAAAHPSMFVAGWRSFIGWVCGLAFAFHFFGIASIVEYLTGIPVVVPDLSELWPLMLGMLGIGGLRTVEKFRGVQRDRILPKK